MPAQDFPRKGAYRLTAQLARRHDVSNTRCDDGKSFVHHPGKWPGNQEVVVSNVFPSKSMGALIC